jgi:hypothetical protein
MGFGVLSLQLFGLPISQPLPKPGTGQEKTRSEKFPKYGKLVNASSGSNIGYNNSIEISSWLTTNL